MVSEKVKRKPYFGEREEQAVVDYNNAETAEEKNRIYNEILKVPFRKMLQSILRRYPHYVGNYLMEEVEAYALTHLIEQMVKFKPDRINKSGLKTKAYSYCQTIVRNYYRDHSVKAWNDKLTNMNFEEYFDQINDDSRFQYEIDNGEAVSIDVLVENIITSIENKLECCTTLKKNEICVGEAIVNILKYWPILFMEETPEVNVKTTNKYQKNKIILLLREQTGLSTKDIRQATKAFIDIYQMEKNNFFT